MTKITMSYEEPVNKWKKNVDVTYTHKYFKLGPNYGSRITIVFISCVKF